MSPDAQVKFALPKWHEWLVYGSLGLLFLTGLAWLLLGRFGKVEGAFGLEPNPALPWLLTVHGIVAYAFLIVLGMLVPVHMVRGWSAGHNRRSGLTIVSAVLVLAASGLVLYYSSAEALRGNASTAHWLLGLIFPLILVVHIVQGRRTWPR